MLNPALAAPFRAVFGKGRGYLKTYEIEKLTPQLLAFYITLTYWCFRSGGKRLDSDACMKHYKNYVNQFEELPASRWDAINKLYLGEAEEEEEAAPEPAVHIPLDSDID